MREDEALTGEIVDAIDALPEEQRAALTTVLVAREFHAGPVPSPQTLADYARILPEAPREIFDMARREQNHQISYRDRALDSEINYRLLTLLAAFLIVFTMVVGTIYLASTNHEKAAIALGAASGLTLLAGAFLRGRDLFPKSEPPKPPASKPPTAPRPRAAQRRPKR